MVTAKLDIVNYASDELLVGGLAQFGEQFDSPLASYSTEATQLLFSGILSPFKQENVSGGGGGGVKWLVFWTLDQTVCIRALLRSLHCVL